MHQHMLMRFASLAQIRLEQQQAVRIIAQDNRALCWQALSARGRELFQSGSIALPDVLETPGEQKDRYTHRRQPNQADSQSLKSR